MRLCFLCRPHRAAVEQRGYALDTSASSVQVLLSQTPCRTLVNCELSSIASSLLSLPCRARLNCELSSIASSLLSLPCRALVNCELSSIASSLLSLPCRARLNCHPSTEITHALTDYVTSLHSTELPTLNSFYNHFIWTE
jgi:hypothetical protein